MSKSLGNFISILAEPTDMFGKFMSIPDSQLELYFKLLTDLRDAQWDELAHGMSNGTFHPRDVKRLLAHVIVADLNGWEAAEKADQFFQHRIVEKEVPVDLPLVTLSSCDAKSWSHVLWQLSVPQIKSLSDARRVMDSNGVHQMTSDGEGLVHQSDALPVAGQEVILRIGKRTYVRFLIRP
jgi:tyrosyl-tRNA synthetase